MKYNYDFVYEMVLYNLAYIGILHNNQSKTH